MTEQVENKRLNQVEVKFLLQQVETKLSDKETDEKKKQALLTRKQLLESITPIQLPLKYQDELEKLYKKQLFYLKKPKNNGFIFTRPFPLS